MTLYNYAMAGNIRGNGHYNASRRTKERDQFGYQPKTINIGGKWVSYKGIPGVEQVLSIIGDMAYYSNDVDEHTLTSWNSKLTWTIASSFLNETPLQGLEPLIAATNGDMSGWNRLIANSLRSTIPASGGLGVLSNAITSSQKDLEGEIHEYIANRLPIASSYLPERIDIWTGEPLNDIDNPILRGLNAISPFQVSGTAEPWRIWLLESGWDGISMLKKDSTGSYSYTAKERELINQYIGEQQMYKKLKRLMNSSAYKEDLKQLKILRSSNADLFNDKIELKTKMLPLYKELDQIVRNAQLIAEQRLLTERPDVVSTIRAQQHANFKMKQGDVKGASQIQKNTLDKQKLLQYGGSR